PTEYLIKFANECLEEKFENSGLVLQDIVNQAGERLGFDVEYGLYQGSSNTIGYDGIWQFNENINIIVEVKTTDAYRINLDHIYGYKRKLMDREKIPDKASFLIVVGRKDTGDLEAQIRGSRYGWDFRLISVDSLMKLVQLKESLNDAKTVNKISEILCPLEFTRLDRLIEIVFETTQDIQLESDDEIFESIQGREEDEIIEQKSQPKEDTPKKSPVKFQDKCLSLVEKKLNTDLIKVTRSCYQSNDKKQGFLCSISKEHKGKSYTKYWFAFHPYQGEFLNKFSESFIVFGCGSENNTILLPFDVFKQQQDRLWTTEKDGRIYWHVVIYERNGEFEWKIPDNDDFFSLDRYKIIA
ncbi:MAG: hypothetical protein VKJ27_07850, partial [Synechocystis sp.]|nr:hypothetical protein [Synechocystis sp.]